ncbi:hypothetical protein [Phenylobacterium montanum]|uniref:Uncharacterized protein n=1 Tax=Phenylobacterium montanum TaxID=2823693 RepID=A0A975G4T9_9CAUL|nr:hypothetical protein [Caulobacter sp. S6]QUD90579.1 hypothetical protein KCG34_12260 [Caulobacter sp. S6]
MRFVWAYGMLTAWLLVPFGFLMANEPSGTGLIGLLIGGTGLLAVYYALAVLIYRVLKTGDLAERAEEIEEQEELRRAREAEAAAKAGA